MNQATQQNRRTALVFGGSRGIGAAAVSRLAADGFSVAFTYVSRPDAARDLVRSVELVGGHALAIEADSADPAAIRRAVAQSVEHFGAISVLVVNAGILAMGSIDAVPLVELDRMLDINVRGVFLAIQATAPHLLDGGRVITIGSNVAVRCGFPGTSVYQMTKHALVGLVRGAALDFAPRRITVNNIQPGPIDTDMNAGSIDYLSGLSPLKRVGQPSEVAGLISYLARDEAGYVTGASLTIDGGLTV